jgi:alpha-galactosidase
VIRHVRRRGAKRPLGLLSTLTLLAGTVPAVLFAAAPAANALDNGLAPVPPMGWNDWNAFGCSVDEQLVEQTADAFVTSGMRDAGYKYLNIDDCWALPTRDADGNLVANPAKFPSGIAALADYVHARGLKLGIYEDSGTKTCSSGGGFPGSLGHEDQDAMLFARWHVDYLKYDDCNVPADGQNPDASIARYETMRDALAKATAATGQDIVFSICEKGDFGVPNSAWPSIGNLWRTTGDIHDNYSKLIGIFHQNVTLADLAGPNHWNDPDMLEIGNGGMTDVEYRTHFTLWAEMAAPLIAGTDVRNMSAATTSILTNRDVIAVDQDPLGAQGRPVASSDGHWVLSKPLANGDRAVTLFNETDVPATISTTAAQVGLHSAADYRVRDLWAHDDSESAGTISAALPAHAAAMYRVTPLHDVDVSTPPHVGFGLAGLGDDIAVGTPTTATVTVTDDGRLPLVSGHVKLQTPAGWTVQPSTLTVAALAPGRTERIPVRVTAPPTARPLPEDTLSAALEYAGPSGSDTATSFVQTLHRPTPVAAPYRTFAAVDKSTNPRYGQLGDAFAIIAAGADVSGTNNQYGTIYQKGALSTSGKVTTRVTAQQVLNTGMKSGLMIRRDVTQANTSPGYVTLEVAPSNRVQMQWDTDGNGQLDASASASLTGSTPIWLRLTRDGTTFTGAYSTDGSTWKTVSSATVPTATGAEDAGMFTSSHNKYDDARADFGPFSVTNS